MGTVNHTQFVLVMYGVSLKTPFLWMVFFMAHQVLLASPMQAKRHDSFTRLSQLF